MLPFRFASPSNLPILLIVQDRFEVSKCVMRPHNFGHPFVQVALVGDLVNATRALVESDLSTMWSAFPQLVQVPVSRSSVLQLQDERLELNWCGRGPFGRSIWRREMEMRWTCP
jgi:hypothetical protein